MHFRRESESIEAEIPEFRTDLLLICPRTRPSRLAAAKRLTLRAGFRKRVQHSNYEKLASA